MTPGQGLFVKSQQLSSDQVNTSNFGNVPSVDSSLTLDFSVPTAPRQNGNGAPAALYNTADGKAPNGGNGLGLRSDCQPAANCQAGQLTTAYNTTNFIAAEDFVPLNTGFVTTACLQGIFWNGNSTGGNINGWCTDGQKTIGGTGFEDWTLTFYKDLVGDGVPDTVIGTYTFCTGIGCGSNGPNVISAVKDVPTTGSPDFAGIPIERVTVAFNQLGEDGPGGVVPLNGGECYYLEWAVITSDTTSGAFGCAWFHQAGVPGNGRAMQDAAFDGYDCCESLTEDLTLCVDLELDNSAVLGCDTCVAFPPPNESCANAIPVADGASELVDTAGAILGNADLPDVPGLEGFDQSGQEGVFYSFVGTGTQVQFDFASSIMDTTLAIYCGACDETYYGVAGDDDTGGGINGTDAQLVLESELGRTYIIYCSSTFKCGQGVLTVLDLGAGFPSTVPAEACSTCTLTDFGTATVDEVAIEACDDSGNTRPNDGCNTTGLATDFTPLVDGDVVSGSSWQLAGTRDTDWFSFNVADAGGAIVTWQAEAQFNFNIFLIDIGGDINNADCANLVITQNNSALRCNTATVSAVIAQGDYVAWVGSQEFDFGACSTGVSGYGPDTAYNAALSIASCDIADPGENQENEQCSTIFQNNEGCNAGVYQTTAMVPGDGWWFGASWANAGSRDTDFYSWTQASSGEVSVTVEAEFPVNVFVIDMGPGGHIGGAGCPGTIVDAWASVACNQLNFTSSTLIAGNDYSLFVGMGNLDGSGIFGGFPCPDTSGFNEYVMRVDAASSGACGAMGVVGACYSDCVSASENDCTSQCGVFYGVGSACPATTCIADQTTTGIPAGNPGYGEPDGDVTGADIQFYVNLYNILDCRADLTTTGAGIGNSGYGIRDGQVTGADIQFYVNAYVDGAATLGASCNPGGPCTP